MLAWSVDGGAAQFQFSGRVTAGVAYRLEAPDPDIVNQFNAAQLGMVGRTTAGVNLDDGELNFHRHDLTSAVVKAMLDLGWRDGGLAAFARVKAWHDAALADGARPWGNVPNNFAAGQPLSDAGAPPLSRFSGVVLAEAYVEQGGPRWLARLGQQTLGWGEQASFGGGLQALNAVDFPALHRPGVSTQEIRLPAPMLYARAQVDAGLALEGFYQWRFRANALDECGTFWSPFDAVVEGCGKGFVGPPAVNDRARLAAGAYMLRIPAPLPSDGSNAGIALTWKMDDTQIGLFRARYTNRAPSVSVRTSLRTSGAPMVAGNGDGKNPAYFVEYADDIDLTALNVSHQRDGTMWYGELSYRPNMPVPLSSSDILNAFTSNTALSLLRADAAALGPGAVFRGFDRHRFVQAQLGWRRQWGAHLLVLEVVDKLLPSLPGPALRRYGRFDAFGPGPVNGVCAVATSFPFKQCSPNGYISRNAWAWRARLDSRLGQPWPGAALSATAGFVDEVKGWSVDGAINQGRQSAQLALRLAWRQRYSAELAWSPIWGGDYNPLGDKDQLSLAVGVQF